MNDLNEEKLIKQMAYRILAIDDSVKAAEYIFECMNDSFQTPEDVSSSQALFMEVTGYLSSLNKEYSLECSHEYLKLVKDRYGDKIKNYSKGENDE